VTDDFFAGISERWPAGREDYHWHVLPDPDAVRNHLAVPYAELVGRSGLAPVAPEWSHITVDHGPPAAGIGEEEIARQVEYVREECRHVGAFAAWIQQPQVWRAAVVCPVYYGEDFRRLQALVRRAAGHAEDPLYYPHLSLAYGTGSRDDRPLRVWLSDDDRYDTEIRVAALTLVRQRHDRASITWDVAAVVPLGAEGQR
jgi:2'-5' RNA ligase